ncbi:hypothetical protein MIR68_011934 [Amoeboaphelidium protococcarum]|nr:hypothetical protein MIR68_011934 [Amoeboaphelidium protococcarum]
MSLDNKQHSNDVIALYLPTLLFESLVGLGACQDPQVVQAEIERITKFCQYRNITHNQVESWNEVVEKMADNGQWVSVEDGFVNDAYTLFGGKFTEFLNHFRNHQYKHIILFISSHGVSEKFAVEVNNTPLIKLAGGTGDNQQYHPFGKYPLVHFEGDYVEESFQKFSGNNRRLTGGEILMFQRGFADLESLLDLWRTNYKGERRPQNHFIEIVVDSCYSGKFVDDCKNLPDDVWKDYIIHVQSSCGSDEVAAVALFFQKFFELNALKANDSKIDTISSGQSSSEETVQGQTPKYYTRPDTLNAQNYWPFVASMDTSLCDYTDHLQYRGFQSHKGSVPALPTIEEIDNIKMIGAVYKEYKGECAIYAGLSYGKQNIAIHLHYKEKFGQLPQQCYWINTGMLKKNNPNGNWAEKSKGGMTQWNEEFAQNLTLKLIKDMRLTLQNVSNLAQQSNATNGNLLQAQTSSQPKNTIKSGAKILSTAEFSLATWILFLKDVFKSQAKFSFEVPKIITGEVDALAQKRKKVYEKTLNKANARYLSQ